MDAVIKAVIVHKNRLFREGLAFVISHEQNMAVLSCVAEASEVLGEIGRLCPDVIILDFSLPGREGLNEARQLHSTYPEAKLLMIGVTELESDFLACIEAGAVGYLLPDASLEELLNNIRVVVAGETLCSPRVVSLLCSQLANKARERERLQDLRLIRLTPREREVVSLIEERLSNKEIAVRLQIEVKTVKNHVSNILEKLQLENRLEVAQYARERGLLSCSACDPQ